MSAEEKLAERGIVLPVPPSPIGNYVGAVRAGNLLFLAGHIPIDEKGKPKHVGKVGEEVGAEEGYQAARLVGLNLLGTTRKHIGSLDNVGRIVKVLGMVNAAPGFTEVPKIINGFSDLIVDIFGEEVGRHARSAVGVSELPMNVPVEIEMILELSH